MTSAIADSGWVIALLNRADPQHGPVLESSRRVRGTVWLPSPALTEICFVLDSRIGQHASASFLERLADPTLSLAILDPTDADYSRAAQLLRKYGDIGADFVDALVVAACERLKSALVLTLDRRHVGVMTDGLKRAPEILP